MTINIIKLVSFLFLLFIVILFFNLPIYNPNAGVYDNEKEEYEEFLKASKKQKKELIENKIRAYDLTNSASNSKLFYEHNKFKINEIIQQIHLSLKGNNTMVNQIEHSTSPDIPYHNLDKKMKIMPFHFSFRFNVNDSIALLLFSSLNKVSLTRLAVYVDSKNNLLYLQDLSFDENILIENQSSNFQQHPGVAIDDQLKFCIYDYAFMRRESARDFQKYCTSERQL